MQNRSHQLFLAGHNLESIKEVEKGKLKRIFAQRSFTCLILFSVVKTRRIVEGPQSEALVDYINETGRLFNHAAMELLS